LIRSSPSKVVVDPVTVHFFSGPRAFQVPLQAASVLARDAAVSIAQNVDLSLPAGRYIAIVVRTDAHDPYVAKKFCDDYLDETIANVSLIHDPGLFVHQVYRGWLLDQDRAIVEAWVQVKDSFAIRPDVESILVSMREEQGKNGGMPARYRLMARFFAKSLLLNPGEEKFFYLWTMLEIYPMTDTSNIKSVSDLLGTIVARDAQTVKERLGIGQLFGVRSRLIHDGEFSVPVSELGDTIVRLESICIEVLRKMSGMNYSGSLERHFLTGGA